jgi:hypothetical protein
VIPYGWIPAKENQSLHRYALVGLLLLGLASNRVWAYPKSKIPGLAK